MSATTLLVLLALGVYLAIALGIHAGAPWMCWCPRSRCDPRPRRNGWECLDCGRQWDRVLGDARTDRVPSYPLERHIPRSPRRWGRAAWYMAEGARLAWREVWR